MELEEFADELLKIPERMAALSFRDTLEDAANEASESIGNNFQRCEDSNGNPWPPHSPTTIRLHGPHPLLKLTWTMYHAATNIDDPNAIKRLEDRSIVFGISGSGVPYVNKQNEGEGIIPRREFFYIGIHELPRIDRVVADGVDKQMEKVLP